MAAQLPPDAIERLSRFVPRRDLEAMRVVREAPWRWLPPLLGMGGVTFGHFVVFRAGRFRPDTPRGLALIAHEAGHVGQFRELGKIRFTVKYLVLNVRCRFRHDRHPLERELVALQREVRQALEAED